VVLDQGSDVVKAMTIRNVVLQVLYFDTIVLQFAFVAGWQKASKKLNIQTPPPILTLRTGSIGLAATRSRAPRNSHRGQTR
jgi:hypothetical protein